MARQIADAELQPQDVPGADAEWPQIWHFALTADGYARLGSFEAVAELGNSAAAAFAQGGVLPTDLKTLRFALFFEQRRHHHFGGDPSGSDAQYIRALVCAIGDAVAECRGARPVDAVRQNFDRLGITLPSIPSRVEHELRAFGDWCLASREIDPLLMYFFDRYVWEAVAGETPDYVAFSHAGHGAKSYGLTYHLVDGPLVLMVQSPYGGIYADEGDARDRANAQFRRCDALVAAVERARSRGLPDAPGRLIVCESLLRGMYAWGWLEEPASGIDAAKAWLDARQLRSRHGAERPAEGELPTVAARRWLETASFSSDGLHAAGQTAPTPTPAEPPERKERDLSADEKRQIRERLARGEVDSQRLAAEFNCSVQQIAAIKAWNTR